jgi:type IV secretion system protein VirD4
MFFNRAVTRSSIQTYGLISVLKYVFASKIASKLFLILDAGVLLGISVLILSNSKGYQSDQMKITPDISTPVPAGQGQCGTAKWLNKKVYDRTFGFAILDLTQEIYNKIASVMLLDIKEEYERIIMVEEEVEKLKDQARRGEADASQSERKEQELKDIEYICDEVTSSEYEELRKQLLSGDFDHILFKNAGIVFGKTDGKSIEKIYYNPMDNHTLILGATRSGKGRVVGIETICALALSGESMIITDPKPELLYYTGRLLTLLGYQIITQDYKNPTKSSRFNYLQEVMNCVIRGDIPAAIDATWDITSQLVGEPKGERLWNDGEASIIAASIMAVVYDNRAYENRKYINFTNVYYFISQMCTPIVVGRESVVPLNVYMRDLPYEHPSKALLSVGEIAPSRTRGSFYTSALMTLKLFTNPLIADMTSTSDYDAYTIGKKKTAVFIILPDERKTYASLASLYVSMQYQILSKAADLRGGRLERRVNYILDEFGNFAKIANFTSMLTVGGGKGIRFNLFVQDFTQIKDVYDDNQAIIIRGNCENWIYLQSDDPDTLKTLSDKLDKYTISTYSLSSNHQKFSNPSSSHNISLTGRELLTSGEIKKIKRPYSLVTSRNDPAIHYAPDLSKWYFNTLLGMGDEEHNRRIRLARENLRPARKVTGNPELWGIWDKYIEIIRNEQKEKELQAERQMMERLASSNY